LQRGYDLVGLSGFSSQIGRVRALSQIFRARGNTLAIGGPACSTTPELYVGLADVLFIGEAEYTWPAFLKEWEKGTHRKIYRQVIKPELEASRVPAWELMGPDVLRYVCGAIQTARGCPFDCEFCDVPYIFGHRPRTKPIDDVLKEIDIQYKLGVRRIFFVDDNFIGDLRYARKLLKELVVYDNSLPQPVYFFTQLTLNVAKNEDVLEMLADANFSSLFIGVETPNIDSLKETKKLQNCYTDIISDVHKVESYGLSLTSGIIVGFDHDRPEIFTEQFGFMQESSIPLPVVNLLAAQPGTRLWYRMQREGRMLAGDEESGVPKSTTNVVPRGMSRVEFSRAT